MLSALAVSQNDTIRILKNECKIYKCTSENAYSWYIYFIDNKCILADLKINPSQVKDWFGKF
jgi:hypothetical protein